MKISKNVRIIKYTEERIKVFYKGDVLGFTNSIDGVNKLINRLF